MCGILALRTFLFYQWVVRPISAASWIYLVLRGLMSDWRASVTPERKVTSGTVSGRAGLGSNLSRADIAALGFYVCVADLEDELIRALGVVSVEEMRDAQGELGSFGTLQKQPAWQGRAT